MLRMITNSYEQFIALIAYFYLVLNSVSQRFIFYRILTRNFQKSSFFPVAVLCRKLSVDVIFLIAFLLTANIICKEKTYKYRLLRTDSCIERKVRKILSIPQFS